MVKEKLTQVWPEWQIEKQLGKGSYGEVYQVVRRDSGIEDRAAIKVISIPSDNSELDSLRSEGASFNDAKTYFKGIVNDFVNEIQLMNSLKGIQNIVSVEDYKVIERTDEIGWDIFIRMELLTPFNNFICNRQLTEADVINLGLHICSALEICSQRNIIHRDIKPENIFINNFGYFKLGDFGVARKLENVTGGMSQKGTLNYIAPEVVTGTNYDARVDIYSLGIVLYRLMNNNRLPFIETEQQQFNPNERKFAMERRIRGDVLPPPCAASPQLAAVILKACAFDPNNRFSSASELKTALQKASRGQYIADSDATIIKRKPTGVPTTPVQPKSPTAPPAQPNARTYPPVTPQPPKKKFSFICILALICCVLPLIIALIAEISEEESVKQINLGLAFLPSILAVIGILTAKRAHKKGILFALISFAIGVLYIVGAIYTLSL